MIKELRKRVPAMQNGLIRDLALGVVGPVLLKPITSINGYAYLGAVAIYACIVGYARAVWLQK